MRYVALLAWHDLRLILRERATYIWLFAVPLVFVYFMGLAARGPGGPEVARPTVLINNRDGGFLGGIFVRELGEQGLHVVGPQDAAGVDRGITVPPDFTERVLQKRRAEVDFFSIAGRDEPGSALVEVRLMRAVVAINGLLVEHAVRSGGAPPTEAALDALLHEPAAVVLESRYAGRKPRPVGFALSLPGNLVMYLFMNVLIFGGAAMASERRTGVLRRLAVSPMTRRHLILGKLLGLILLAAVQIAFFLAFGELLFGVRISENLGGVVVILMAFAWVAASVGLLIGSLLTAEDKVVGVGLLVALPMAAIGGCWWPLEMAPRFLQLAALATPTGWALTGLHQLITFGGTLADAWMSVTVLAAFGVVASTAAVRCFRV